MSKTLTVPQRLALSKWAHTLGDTTPTLPLAAEWVKEQFGKDVSEAVIQSVLERTNPRDVLHAYDDGEIGPLIRPGFGYDLTVIPRGAFPSATHDWNASTLTFLELAMLWFIEQITNKPDWHVKVFNDDIVSKWKTEVMAVDWEAVDLAHAHFTDAMFDWCLAELREKAKLYEATGLVPVFDVTTAVLKSDNAIPPEVKEELKNGVAVLEDLQEHEKDWHPGSDGKVLDLVHPSLWPLVYGLSRIVPDKRIPLKGTVKACGTGQAIPELVQKPENHRSTWSPFYDRSTGHSFSHRFQWLPCDIDIEHGKPSIVSYINNLHPDRHAGLYTTIEKVIAKALPMWDVIYRWHKDFEVLRITCKAVGRDCQAGCTECCSQYNRPLEPDEEERDMDEYWEEEDQETPSQTWQRDKTWFNRTHPVKRPDVPEYRPMRLQPEDVNLKGGFFNGSDRIQVIVKLANIHLSPEKPTYDGGSWHIEGQVNERICATALYYYDNDNITESSLAFRTTADKEELMSTLSYEQDDYYCIERTFKIDGQGINTQELGSVLTREDRLLAFPNVYEHLVAPFELVDKTKPGHRKILALFLVDPAIPIISTANVPPQQRDWWKEGVMPSNRMGPLPAEVADMVFDNLDFPIGLEKAKKLREELMAERTKIARSNRSNRRDRRWNFCEH
ncbi:uncharacterized protein ColSpa_06940 [Colletotrichum spaethianum]|uniref:Uncharacterized protein n=1 Tax=Colletotrichum spaethianum TaxID=700344 RepID=A0AA37P813_9PEZI|nr:uncharacterized protein ColSpa_06940 [Colletotrichum spaethianum]GKT46759.1 hypothetical protein ColSpa_06940 [Colletotrichum spaethianum]